MYVFLLLLIQLVKKVGTKVSERKMLLEIIFRNLQLMSPYFWTTLYIPNHSNFGRNKSNSKLGRVLKQRICDMKRKRIYSSFESFHFVCHSIIRLLLSILSCYKEKEFLQLFQLQPQNAKVIFYNIFQNTFIGKILANNTV